MDEEKLMKLMDTIANIKMTVKTISKICDNSSVEPEIAYMCTFLENQTKQFDNILKDAKA